MLDGVDAGGWGWLKAGGARLEAWWIGPAPDQAATLVFLHEGLGSAALWKGFPERVAAATGLGALVYSRAGYGGSDPIALPRPLNYLEIEALEVLPAVLDAAGIQRAVLVGHSDGASIALVNAGASGDPRIAGAVAMAPHVFNEQRAVDGIRRAVAAFETGGLRERLKRHHGANVDCAFRGWSGAWLDPEFWHWNIEGYLPSIRAPLLLIQGRDDEYGTAAQIEAIERQTGGPFETVWLSGGHTPHREHPEDSLAAIARFVSGLSPGPV
ncbi:MAG: alpha/beta hydrolase [Ectothiorhodospiraceae bacterium]|jgi:pimeloyl-ACP methyl ester carboxylesterase